MRKNKSSGDVVMWLSGYVIKLLVLLITIHLITNHCLYSAFDVLNTGARPYALGGAYSAISDDAYATNPAGFSSIEKFEISANYNNLYSVSDIENYYFSFVLPANKNVLGFSFHRLGISGIYYEDIYFLRYARAILEKTSLGLNFKFYGISAPGYETLDDILYKGEKIFSGYDIGFLYNLSDELKIAALGTDLNSPGYKLLASSPDSEKIKSDFIFAVCYTKFNKIVFTGEYQFFNSELRLGSEVSISDILFVRLGSNRNNFTGGIGIRISTSRKTLTQFDFGFAMHRTLGLSYQISTIFRWGK